MKWNNIFFNANFTETVQKGIDDFARLSGYHVGETKQPEKNRPSPKRSLLYLLLLCLMLAILLSTLPLNACNKRGDKKILPVALVEHEMK
jgi:hypothetical protein